jgi:hypothetical protein
MFLIRWRLKTGNALNYDESGIEKLTYSVQKDLSDPRIWDNRLMIPDVVKAIVKYDARTTRRWTHQMKSYFQLK